MDVRSRESDLCSFSLSIGMGCVVILGFRRGLLTCVISRFAISFEIAEGCAVAIQKTGDNCQ
jgi:hypothetical protein